ncbi:MAG: ABC transporter ATP-binding protein [bacterium]
MKDFWRFAKLLLEHRGRVVAALTFGLLSAGGLGAGLLAATPVLEIILQRDPAKAKDLPKLAEEANTKFLGGHVPQAWIDALPTGQFTAVVWVVGALGLLTLFGAFCNFMHAYLSMTVVAKTIADLRERTFTHLVRLPLATVVRMGHMTLVRRVSSDTGMLAAGFNTLLSRSFAQLTKGVAAGLAAFYTNFWLALSAMVAAPILYTVVRRTGKIIRRGSRAGLNTTGGLMAALVEVGSNLRVVKSSTSEKREQARFAAISRELLAIEMKIRTARAIGTPLVESLTIFALGGLSLVAANAIIRGSLQPAEFFVTLASLGIAAASLKPLMGMWHDLQTSSAAAQELAAMLALPEELTGDEALPTLARHRESIRFDRVTLTYPGAERPAVRELSLEIRHGQTVAFVGPNGCGKTTLLSLIPRLLEPDAGSGGVYVDGVDIRTVSRVGLRQQIGVVTQETVLFKGTIRSNIASAVETASDEQVRSAARKARAEEFILQKPKGYDDPVGEGGSGLSGGQRQRIAIARAVLRDPAILILDEATSMIDSESEARIAEAITEFSKGRTCLVVAHRLSTVINADRIVVMEAGRMVDSGTHGELLGRCPLYRSLVEHQMPRNGGGEGGGTGTPA